MTPEDSDTTEPPHVLIVESSPTQAMKLRYSLTQHGYEVTSARSSRDALAALAAQAPFLVLSNAVLPDTDGYQLCRQIKAQPPLRDVHVILMASLSDPQAIVQLLECGADDVLPKPYDDDSLLSRLDDIQATQKARLRAGTTPDIPCVYRSEERRLPPERGHERLDMLLSLFEIGGRRELLLRQLRETVERQAEQLQRAEEAATNAPPPAEAPAPPGPGLRILLAEDSEVNQRLGVRTLEKHGHTVVVAADGRQALAALDRGAFDLVLMDVEMPEMNGLEATAAVRERERSSGAHVAIVAMTAHTDPADLERCLTVGMDGYIAKPLQMEALAPFLTQTQPAGEVAFDHAAALANVEGDTELLQEIVGLFLEEAPRLLEAIRNGITEQDSPALERAAHSLKGSAASLGAAAVVPAAQALENLGRGGQFAGASDALPRLEAALAALTPVLTALGRENQQ